ncbi:MAG: protein TolQ [Alphaproteobacteria bacterium]
MENAVVDTVQLAGSMDNASLSIWGLFLQADFIVKSVMIILVLASFWSWSIIFEKSLRLRRLRRDTDAFEAEFWSGTALESLYKDAKSEPEEPMSAVFVAAMGEYERAARKGIAPAGRAWLQQRIERAMDITIGREMERLERYMPFLASVGSTAPFVGLFGTVWGIMNSFQAIGMTKSTSLAVVAPGIAEALFATALGLIAAIPAVLAYNKLSGDLGRYAGRLEAFAGEFIAILSREFEEK